MNNEAAVIAQKIIDLCDLIIQKEDLKERPPSRNYSCLKVAVSQLGVVEWADGSNPQVEKYLDYGSRKDNRDSGLSDSVPWCAGFVAWCLENTIIDGKPMGSTNSLMARSYENWGKSSKNDPLPGDIVTFYRNGLSSGQGHVGFFIGRNGNNVFVLGGNQSDEVNISSYSMSRMTDIRRSSKQFVLSDWDKLQLESLVDDIQSGVEIEPPGSVV